MALRVWWRHALHVTRVVALRGDGVTRVAA